MNRIGIFTSRQRAAGNGQQATGSRQRAAGNGQQATGSRQQAAGSRQQAANLRFFTYFSFFLLNKVLLSNALSAQSYCYGISPVQASGSGIDPLAPCDVRYVELDEALVDTILTYKNQVTARTNEVAAMTLQRMDMHLAANRIIKSILADTASIDLAEYRQWLDNKGSKEAAYEKVGTYIVNGDYTTAESIRDNIPLLFNLQGDDLTEHDYYTDLTDIAINALENHVHCSDFDSTTVDEVQAIADSSNGLAARLAQGLLNFYYGYDYETVQSGGSSQQLEKPDSGLYSPSQPFHQPITAMPNPAGNNITFRYALESDMPATLVVFDLNGAQTQSFTLTGQNGSFDWNTSLLPHGIYYCKIHQSGKIYPSLKLALIK